MVFQSRTNADEYPLFVKRALSRFFITFIVLPVIMIINRVYYRAIFFIYEIGATIILSQLKISHGESLAAKCDRIEF